MTESAFSPEELLQKMAYCSNRFETANKYLSDNFSEKTVREQKARVLIMAGRHDLLTNRKLALHLESLLSQKTKITLDLLASMVSLELGPLATDYEQAEMEAKISAKEYEIWQGQLMWHMSKNKREGIELSVLR